MVFATAIWPIAFMAWNQMFPRTEKKVPVSIAVRPARLRGLSLEWWFGQPANLAESQKLFETPLMRDIIDVLHSERPQGFPIRGYPVESVSAHVELGRVEGYNDCLRILLALPHPPAAPIDQIQSTFETPENEILEPQGTI